MEQSVQAAQSLVRSRDANADDCFLISPAIFVDPLRPNCVVPMSSQYAADFQVQLMAMAPAGQGEGTSERVIRKVLSRQQESDFLDTLIGDPAADTLPGGGAVVDHLACRAREENCWKDLVPVIEKVQRRRISPLENARNITELVIGHSSREEIAEVTERLRQFKKDVEQEYHFCLLAGDVESIQVPAHVVATVSGQSPLTKVLHFKQPAAFCKGVTVKNLPVRFMIGHDEWAVHLRVPLNSVTASGDRTLTLNPGQFRPELQELIDVAGSLVGVSVQTDIDEFCWLLRQLYGRTLNFAPPISATTLARLAGFNLAKGGVQSLVWTVLGGFLPKKHASVGDGLWNEPASTLSDPYVQYLAGDTAQVALLAWVLVVVWTYNIFPDFHAVAKCSVARHVGDLIRHWATTVVEGRVSQLYEQLNWDPVTSRREIVERVAARSEHRQFFGLLTPDWPAVTAGGCRYFHTARAWLVDRLPLLQSASSDFWHPMYREEVQFLRLGREVPADRSPVAPTSSPRIAPNPEITDILHLPASEIDKPELSSLVFPKHPKRTVLLEYALTNPSEAAHLLERLETNKRLCSRLFRAPLKIRKFIHELRDTLTVLGAMPRRSADWVDPYPPREAVLQGERQRTRAEQIMGFTLRKVNALMARYNELNDAAAAGGDVNRVLNHRGLGRAEDEERVLTSLGSRDQEAARKVTRSMPPPCHPPTAPRRSPSPSGSAISIEASGSLLEESLSQNDGEEAAQVREPRQSARSPTPLAGPSHAPVVGGHVFRVVRRLETPDPEASEQRERSPTPPSDVPPTVSSDDEYDPMDILRCFVRGKRNLRAEVESRAKRAKNDWIRRYLADNE